jgi:acyl-CoA thioester hydrolase
MSDAIFTCHQRVSYAECTVGNHVYYARYLDWLERARGEFFRSLGTTFQQWQEADVIFPVLEATLRYRAPARYDDELCMEVWPTVAEKVRLNFGYRIIKVGGGLVLEAETRHVCTGMNEKPKRLPPELVTALTAWLRPAPWG